MVIGEYKLLDVDGLRKISLKNKMQYRKEKISREKKGKQGNGYG